MITLNLLPPERRALLSERRRLRRTRVLAATVLAATAVASLLVSIGRMLLTERTEAVTVQATALQASLQRDELKALTATVSGINERTRVLGELVPRDLAWGAFLADFLRAVPSGITLASLSVDQRTRAVSFSGTAATRDDLLRFQSAITAAGFVDHFSTPLTDLSQSVNIAIPTVTAAIPAETLAHYHRNP